MPEEDRSILRVYGKGNVSVRQVSEYLRSTVAAYESLLAFEVMVDQYQRAWQAMRRAGPDWPFLILHEGFWPLAPSRTMRPFLFPSEIHALVAPRDRLRLYSVTLSSPGAWEFLGRLNPLEVIRQYLTDRHERRKDRQYREGAEEERLYLENRLLENRVVRERIGMAKELGARDEDLRPFINVLVSRPLGKLDQYQDQNLIETAEIVTAKNVSE